MNVFSREGVATFLQHASGFAAAQLPRKLQKSHALGFTVTWLVTKNHHSAVQQQIDRLVRLIHMLESLIRLDSIFIGSVFGKGNIIVTWQEYFLGPVG
ncbi:hypothetical protein D3C78_1068200 [compost metagenome]